MKDTSVSSFVHPSFQPARSKALGMRRGFLCILLVLAGAGAFFQSPGRDSWWSYAAGAFWTAGYILMGGNLYGWNRGDLRKLYARR